MSGRVLLLAGDGVGPEVITQAEELLRAVGGGDGGIKITHGAIGGAAIDSCGEPLPAKTLAAARAADAVLLGAVGAPQYDNLPSDKKPEKGLLDLRRGLGAYANLRPIMCYAELADASALKAELVRGLDIMIVRELIGGLYFGEPRGISGEGDARVGVNTMRYDAAEISRIARRAFDIARLRGRRLCSVDKANVLEVSALWREVVSAVGRADYPEVELTHMYVDNAAMQLVRAPKRFDVLLTENMFGDILSDAAAALTGSIGMLPSASLADGGRGLYEPVHGSAPDIAGQDKANPLAAILSAAMLLRHSLAMPEAAARLENAVRRTLADGFRTADIVGDAGGAFVGCAEMGRRVMERLGT